MKDKELYKRDWEIEGLVNFIGKHGLCRLQGRAPLGTQREMLEVCEIFHVTSKCHLQTPLHTTMPGAILDRRFRPRHDTREGARGQAKEEGWSDTMVSGIFENAVQARHGEIVPDPGGNDDRADDSCLEIHGNEGWIENY